MKSMKCLVEWRERARHGTWDGVESRETSMNFELGYRFADNNSFDDIILKVLKNNIRFQLRMYFVF